jgi:predicted short-subunit dehydrogenase-like oxidoreductase (DUF2520 family)
LDPEVTETVSARGGEVPPPTPERTRRPDPEAPPPSPATPPVTLAFVGAGRAAGALAVASAAAGHRVVAVASRDPAHAALLAGSVGARPVPSALAAIRAAEITFLTVPDAAVTAMAASVAASGASLRGRGVVHCSASLGVDTLAALRVTAAAVGSLHPLQALAGTGSAPLLRGALMAIDADPALRTPLHRLAVDLGGLPVALPAAARPLYHAAAVLAGNAPLALLATAAELLEAAGLDPRTAAEGPLTLMEGAVANARRAGPRAALTGPVARGDAATVAAHLAALAGRPDAEALYRAVAQAIVRLAGSEGREDLVAMLNGHREGGTGPRAERSTCPMPPTTTEDPTWP